MCGFVGFTNTDSNSKKITKHMLNRIEHRGPDEVGIHITDKIALGHHRLSIIDLEGGKQPYRVDGSVNSLVYNGEIYSFQNYRDSMVKDGINFKEGSDTEVLFNSLQFYGIDETLSNINGMYAFAYHEEIENRVTLVRDRHGEKPLYYTCVNNQLVFASELSALVSHPNINIEYSEEDVSIFLWLEYLPKNKTAIKDIFKVEPGQAIVWQNGKIVKQYYYWKPELNYSTIVESTQSFSHHILQLDSLLMSSVQNMLVADVPVGVFLSGGLDSSLISAMAKKIDPEISTFSIKMESSSYDESIYAAEVAEYIGSDHNTIQLSDNDLLNSFDVVFSKLDELIGDPSIIPTYLVCNAARRSVKVALGGDGADELFAGYPNYYVQQYSKIFSLLPESTGRLLRQATNFLPSQNKYMSTKYLVDQLSYGIGKNPILQSFYWMSAFEPASQNSLWNDSGIDKRITTSCKAIVNEIVNKSNETGANFLLRLFLSTYLPNDILTKVDRASMYNSLEVRAPFLSKEVSEFASKLPLSTKLKGHNGKVILKELAYKYLPYEIINRKKHGFAISVDSLIRTKFKSRFEEILFDSTSSVKDCFHRPYIEKLWYEHQSGKIDHRKKLWSLFTLFKTAENIKTVVNDRSNIFC